jgi:hypothetical protein
LSLDGSFVLFGHKCFLLSAVSELRSRSS